MLARVFDEYRDSRKVLRRNCHGQSIRQIDSIFEDPFWVGVFEHVSDGKLSVCKVTFGAEQKDYAIYDFVLKNYYRLRFSPAVATDVKEVSRNPKQVQNTGIGTKSQQALRLQQEQLKIERKTVSREQREAEQQRQFVLKQQKRREKHRGR